MITNLTFINVKCPIYTIVTRVFEYILSFVGDHINGLVIVDVFVILFDKSMINQYMEREQSFSLVLIV